MRPRRRDAVSGRFSPKRLEDSKNVNDCYLVYTLLPQRLGIACESHLPLREMLCVFPTCGVGGDVFVGNLAEGWD